jgi:hypothetical protein
VCVNGAWYVVRPDDGNPRLVWPLGCAAFTLLELLPATPGAGAWPDELGAALASARANKDEVRVARLEAELSTLKGAP